MSNIKFFPINIWKLFDVTYSSQAPYFPASNVSHELLTKVWRSNYNVNSDGTNKSNGRFEITLTNQKLYFTEGGGGLTATIIVGDYTPDALAAQIETQLEAAGAHSYTVTHEEDNKFKIVDDTGNCFLTCTNTVNAIWVTIGFLTTADRPLAASHDADNLRIHTSEFLRIDCEAALTINGFFCVTNNLTGSGQLLQQASTDNWATTSVSFGMSASSDGQTYAAINETGSTYRYWGVEIIDPENSDGFVELGVLGAAAQFEPRIGTASKSTEKPDDPSVKGQSDGGQESSLLRNKFWTRQLTFNLVEDKEDWDSMFDVIGETIPLFIVMKKKGTYPPAYTDPEENTFYIKITSWSFTHMVGAKWKGKLRIQKQR